MFLHDKSYLSVQNKQDLYLAFRDELIATIHVTALQFMLPVVTYTHIEKNNTNYRSQHKYTPLFSDEVQQVSAYISYLNRYYLEKIKYSKLCRT